LEVNYRGMWSRCPSLCRQIMSRLPYFLLPLPGRYSASATTQYCLLFLFFLEYPDHMIKPNKCVCTCSISLNTFGTQLRVIEALFAEGIYMVQSGHDGPTTSGCDKMMTRDERRKRGPSGSGTHAHLPKSSS